MTNDEFEKGFRCLKRFLKENGCYLSVMRYLFYDGRTKKDLLKQFNNARFTEKFKWKILFLRINLIGKIYYSNDFHKFTKLVYDTKLHVSWEKYCDDNNIKY